MKNQQEVVVMLSQVLKVSMLNGFSLSLGGNTVSYTDDRSKKSWLLLGYLISKRNRQVPIEELTRIVWEDDASHSAIKTLIHRTRALLDGLGEDAGKSILVSAGGSYAIDREIEISCDAEEFEAAYNAARSRHDAEERLNSLVGAINLYTGDLQPDYYRAQ